MRSRRWGIESDDERVACRGKADRASAVGAGDRPA